MTDHLSTLTLPDDRTRLNRHPDNAKIAATGARVITYDRPGYGASDRHRGRSVNDCVADVISLADSLGIGTFAVTGGSGGGPHCLAVAAALPDRVTRAACIVGVAPYAALGDEWVEGMDPENIKEFGWALDGESRLESELTRESAAMLARMAVDPATLLGDFDLPAADREILARPEIAAVMMMESLTECVRNGIWGWADDDLAFINPWGFDPSTISVPTAVWWGSKDVLVPPKHREWIAHIQMVYGWLLHGTPWQD